MSVQDRHFRAYVHNTMAREILDAETENALARAWRERGDERALHRLIRAYERLAVSMAARYRRYEQPFEDLVQQAMMGLMRAAEKFDPENGARFSTYAAWWVRAALQDYVMRNWSLVRTGTNATQKKLFFHLRRLLSRAANEGEGLQQIIARLSEKLQVPEAEILAMIGRMSGPDLSLDAPQAEGEAEAGRSWLDLVEDETVDTESFVLERLDLARRRRVLLAALADLPERERKIITLRHLSDEPRTLCELGAQLGVSKERVRQLEERALAKLAARVRAELPQAA